MKKGETTYWKVDKPTASLMITGAPNYVSRPGLSDGRAPGDVFVYWPEFRVAGWATEIVDKFRATGAPQFANLTVQQVVDASVNPLTDQGLQYIESITVTQSEADKVSIPIETYIKIANALKEGKKANAAAAAASRVTSTSPGRARSRSASPSGRGPAANQNRLINQFNKMMEDTMATSNELPKILNASKFDSANFTGVTTIVPPTSNRAQAIRPVVNYQGQQISLPVSFQPNSSLNFMNYVDTVVANSNYSNLVGEIKQAANQQLATRQSGAKSPARGRQPAAAARAQSPVRATARAASPTRTGGTSPRLTSSAAPPRSGFQALPTVGTLPSAAPRSGFQALPTVGQALPGVSRLPTTGNVRLPTAMPRPGGLPSVPPLGSTSPTPVPRAPTMPSTLRQ